MLALLTPAAVLVCVVTTARSTTPHANQGGGGAFGTWNDDDGTGMPAYSYQLDQTTEEGRKIAASYYGAARMTQETWGRDPADHLFAFGNDRLVGITSTYGYTQIRQDETGPKFLQDYQPSEQQYVL